MCHLYYVKQKQPKFKPNITYLKLEVNITNPLIFQLTSKINSLFSIVCIQIILITLIHKQKMYAYYRRSCSLNKSDWVILKKKSIILSSKGIRQWPINQKHPQWWYIKPTNQNSLKVPKVVSKRIKKRTRVINSTMSPPSLNIVN